MARKIQARIVIEGKLTAATPLHVGGYGEDFDTDLPLARDGAGQLYVPGTSLAGPLRAWCLDAFDPPDVRWLWGWQKTGGPEDKHIAQGEKEHASLALVEDARVRDARGDLLRDGDVEVRDGVGIDRKWGVAAEQIKFDRAILPRGSVLDLRLSVEVEDDEDESKARAKLNRAKAVLGHLLQALRGGDVPFGAAKTRGLGRVKLTGAKVLVQERSSRAGIIEVLRGGGTPSSEADLIAAEKSLKPSATARLEVEIGWRPRGALMVKSGMEGVGVDMLPLVSGKDGDVALVLTGSSVKGALRAHAERVARTVLGDEEKFDAQISQMSLVKELFGAGKPARSQKESSAGADKEGRIGALAVCDCYARNALPRGAWEKLTTEKEEDLQRELEKVNTTGRAFAQAQHVAIDRWTGGAADAMLFSVLEPADIAWEPLVLTLDLEPRRHAGEGQEIWRNKGAALALLLLTLRDMVAGRVPLGFAVNRGMGDIVVESVRFRKRGAGGQETPEEIKLDGDDGAGGHAGNFLKLAGEALGELDGAWNLERLNDAWRVWRESAEP